MRDMHISHDPVVIADTCNTTTITRTAVNGAEFTDGIAITNDKFRALTGKFLVLWIIADRGKLKYSVVGTNTGRPLDHNMRANDSTGTDFNLRANNRERTYADIASKSGGWIYNCAFVDQIRLPVTHT